MTANYVGALDQGTTGTRFIIFDLRGAIVASAYREHRQIYPLPGWVEHDPLEIWSAACEVMQSALTAGNLTAEDLAAIGVTNQRETTIVWDPATGQPLCNAIVWQCMRTRDICQDLIDQGYGGLVSQRTGLVLATYFSGPKLQWILDHVPGVRARAERGQALFGTVDSWLIWNLTGGVQDGAHVTDVTNASRTMLMNLRTLQWDDELLSLLRIPRAMLPEIRPSSDRGFYGVTTGDGPWGAARVPICGDLGDQQAALVGQACFDAGEAKNTYGTGCFVLLNTGDTPVFSNNGLLTTAAYSFAPGQCAYALEGSIAITGAAVQWLRDNLGLIQQAADTEALAAAVADTGGVYFVPAFSGLFAPYWDMDARGIIVGLTRFTSKEHLIRATLEAICYQTRDVLDAMRADAGLALSALKVDGGAVVNAFLMQLQADILGLAVTRPRVRETTALGAAYAAGLAVGLWSDTDQLRANWAVDRVFEPGWEQTKREVGYRGWKRAVQRAMRWMEATDE